MSTKLDNFLVRGAVPPKDSEWKISKMALTLHRFDKLHLLFKEQKMLSHLVHQKHKISPVHIGSANIDMLTLET